MLYFGHLDVFIEGVLFIVIDKIIMVNWLHQWLSCLMSRDNAKDVYKDSRLLFEVVLRSKE